MVGPTRNKLREAASQPLRSPRSPQSRRRRRVTGAGEPEVEEEPQEEVEKSEQPLPVGGGNLPGGARRYSPRRTRNLKAQNCMQMEMVTKTLFLRRFQFLRCYLEQLLDQVHLLRRRQFSGRATICVAAFLGLLHWIHLVTLFENDRHFSHLSSLEREMTFRTEMGLYYSYFKTIMEAPSFLEGLWMVMNDRLTEYPLVINTVKRFHLYPEIASLFPMFVVGYIEPKKFQKIIYMNMMSVLLCFVLMFGNPMYLSSYYSSSLLMTWVIILKRNKIQRLGVSELNFWLIQGCGWFCGTIILKFLTSKILGVSDHIRLSDLIAARILRFTDFDTLIYTCAPEFDFMEKATPMRYTKTLLLPVVMVITYFIFKKTFRDTLCVLSANTYLRKQLLEHGELIFHTLQLLAFAALAILIMRLKLFLTPHMCVMASLICSRRLFGWLFCRVRFENVIFGILTVMSLQGSVNLHNQWSIIGEFNNLPQEELIEWIQYNTRPDAVFAGAMPIMASVKLSTLHPIVNHPHYEDADLRARTKIVYSIYSRKSAKEVRDKLLELHVNYYILEEAWCVVRTNVQFLTRSYQTCKTKGHCDQYSGRKPGCSMLEIWDVEDPSNAASPPLCSILLKNERPYFSTVFQNSVYRVLKVN
ncbi:PREDICTED: probable C-mannosyltransferase DPY19L2 isoform X3 [Hipposideros armiger]|uniref:Probable C-mannosyltransferase DPY19L2 isoform X3 n=1 Tax=Hipposideros armiger TaxID=186990 RepID=A0A8B7SH86_HIPAR|nr:PREDICTED: probable C-mannosyltransferase DPY19L2 isoform X3 [Hipposideros armiger]